MTNQPPPLDAERVSDERLAELIQLAESAHAMWNDESSRTALVGWRELQRLRATQRESGGESVGPRIGDWRGPLWDAINKYTTACRGAPSRYVYGNTPRMDAVAEVERVVAAALSASQRKECETPTCYECGGIKDGDPLYPAENPLKEYEAYGQRKEKP